ncbi:MAG TPA: AarF/UbiB family protein [Caldisericia bacterium]|nr:AarF/UbiB family protein [Caldisericia bacterium]HRW33669.1 AarF/UbiB family protein [Thermotogota bacterium]
MEKENISRKNNRKRFFQIIEIFSKYGFSYLFRKITLKQHPIDRGIRIRHALEELGTTFIKLGQMLSTRYDLLPVDIIAELRKLQDDVPPIEYSDFMNQLQLSLPDWEKHILYIQEKPLAAASIAQVHRALLLDGSEVVIKVRRPCIQELVKADIEVLKSLANFVRGFPVFKDFDLQNLINEFGMAINREMNLYCEAQALERFNQSFRMNDVIFAPKPYFDLCSETVLIMDYIPGIRFSELLDMENDQIPIKINKSTLVESGADCMFQQVFMIGFLHNDPHPGNLIATKNNRLYFIDFGQVSVVDKYTRRFLLEMVLALTRRDAEFLTLIITEHFSMNDSDSFSEDVKLMFSKYYGKPLAEFSMSEMIMETFKLIRAYKIQVPGQLLLMGKVILMIEGIARKLDPSFNAIRFTEDYLRTRWLSLYSERMDALEDEFLWNFLMSPRKLRNIQKVFDTGKIKLDIESTRIERILHGLKNGLNSLAISIIIAALLISIKNFENQFLAYAGVFILGLFVIYEFLTEGRRK